MQRALRRRHPLPIPKKKKRIWSEYKFIHYHSRLSKKIFQKNTFDIYFGLTGGCISPEGLAAAGDGGLEENRWDGTGRQITGNVTVLLRFGF